MSQLNAIIKLQGKQYRVTEGIEFEVDRLETEAGQKLEITDVLMIMDGDKATVGTPLVKGASVTLDLIEHGKGDKIRVLRYKSKSRYRKTHGHRQYLTTVKVAKITA